MRLEKIGLDRLDEMNRVGSIAFTYPITEPEKTRDTDDGNQQTIQNSCERWGMIDEENNRLMGGMILSDYQTRIGDKWLPLSGVGGVATLPEYRRAGVIRKVFDSVLPHMYERGIAISGLYPFMHSFYAKFGYGVSGGEHIPTVSLEQLRAFPAPDGIKMIETAEDAAAAHAIYEKFAEKRDLSMLRTEAQWKKIMGADTYKDRSYKYLLLRKSESGMQPCAYIVFSPENRDGVQIACAQEAAYLDMDALNRLLGFMSTFYPHYRKLSISMPGDINLFTICPNPYEVDDRIRHSYMLRAINAKVMLESQPVSAALKLAAQVAPLEFSLALKDEFIPQNTGRYLVKITPDGIKCEMSEYAPADMTMSINTFSQLVTGSISFAIAAGKPDFVLTTPCAAAEMLFCARPQYISDHY